MGQITPTRMMANGLVSKTKFQAADIRKPLLAVSGLNDKGNPVWFDHDQTGGSFIIPKSAPELKEIRKLIMNIQTRVRLERKRRMERILLHSCPNLKERRMVGCTRWKC